ncbi:MAG: DUF2130 domain-containing protein [Syntrophorhabdales bacterium]|jgi:hypothetical protein
MGETGTTVISCPHCGRDIALDQALSQRIRQELQGQIDAELAGRKQALAQAEARLGEERLKLDRREKGMETELARRLTEERVKLGAELKKEIEERNTLDMTMLREQLEDKEKKIALFRESELRLRKEKAELEEAKEGLRLEVARQIDEERKKIRGETEKRLAEQYRLREADKDKVIEDLKRQAEDLRRKAEAGSQQLQGEVAELSLEEVLAASFPTDSIEEVPKGVRGADVIQRVCGPMGQPCGTLIWESKRTKAWNDGWIDKLKEDQRELRAEIAVLVSSVLPRGVRGFDRIEGVWVCEHVLASCLARALRSGLIEIAAAKLSVTGKNEKMEVLYEYLSGPAFRQQVQAVVEAFGTMQKDLNFEKRAMEKIWAKREKQIERVVKNVSRMYGSMEGIIGQSMPEIDLFELKALSEGEDAEG